MTKTLTLSLALCSILGLTSSDAHAANAKQAQKLKGASPALLKRYRATLIFKLGKATTLADKLVTANRTLADQVYLTNAKAEGATLQTYMTAYKAAGTLVRQVPNMRFRPGSDTHEQLPIAVSEQQRTVEEIKSQLKQLDKVAP